MADKGNRNKGNHADRIKKEETLRKAIGQAIIDGLLTPASVVRTSGDGYYNQTGGSYTQSGGYHDQTGGGGYTQS